MTSDTLHSAIHDSTSLVSSHEEQARKRASVRAFALLIRSSVSHRRGTLGVVAMVLMLTFGVPLRVDAALVADPQVLYQQMLAAYSKAQSNGWDYQDQMYYLSTIFNAGRAYSLQRPNDPNYGKLAMLAVQMGSGLHYNPLTNHDAATWYVREASLWVIAHTADPEMTQEAQALLERVNAEDDDYALLAKLANEDGKALAAEFPHDAEADVLPLEAAWRSWLLTHDATWRSQALAIAAQPSFPIAHIPLTYGPAFTDAARAAVANARGYNETDRQNAQNVIARLRAAGRLKIIAQVIGLPEGVYLTRLAPADEYFGPMKMSILGIENEMKHVNFMLDYKYGNLEADPALEIAQSVDDMQKVYPLDRDMPKLLLETIQMLDRMTTPAVRQAAQHLQSILLVEYQDSPQAQQLLSDS
jgi:hypothetical protein